MGKKPGPKAAKILQRYQEEQERAKAVSGMADTQRDTPRDTPRDALDRARLKQYEASLHFLKDFVPVTTASGRGLKGKVKLFLERLFRSFQSGFSVSRGSPLRRSVSFTGRRS